MIRSFHSDSPLARMDSATVAVTLVLVSICAIHQTAGAQLHHSSHFKSSEESSLYSQGLMKNPHHSVGRHNPERLSPLDPFVHHHQESTKQLMAEIPDYVDIGPMDDGYDSMLDTDQRNGLSGDDDLDPEENGPILPEPGSYVPSNCSTCVRREELRRRNLEVIKDQILSKLGMQRAPNMTGRLPPRIPPLDHLLDLYGMQGDAPGDLSGGFQTGTVYDEEEDDFHARTEKVIAFAQQLPYVKEALKRAESSVIKGMESMYFKFSDKVTRTSKVDKAHLWLYIQNHPPTQSQHHRHHHSHLQGLSSVGKMPSYGANNATVWIHIYKVVRVPEGESPILNLVRKTRVALPPMDEKHGKQTGGWVSFDVNKVVADWFRWPEENYGLVVHAIHADPSSKSSSFPYIINDSVTAEGSLVPFVEVVTTDGRKHRTKRTIGLNCDETSSETRCCRYPLTVDFVEFGWDWIIAPKKYEANYCSGECPYVFLQKYPHTHIVQQANPTGTAGPCCAPRKMSSISMLYFDNEFNIIHGNLPGMVVDRCGCS